MKKTVVTIAALTTLCLSWISLSDKATAKTTNACALVSSTDLRSWFGEELTARADLLKKPQASECIWNGNGNESGQLIVQIVPARYYEEPKLAPDFRRLVGIGEKAYLISELGGWRGAALKGRSAVAIRLDGGKSSRATALAALETLVRKL